MLLQRQLWSATESAEAATEAAEATAESTTEAAEATTEATAEAADKTAEATESAVEGVSEAEAEELLTVDGFNFDKVVEMIDGSELGVLEKTTLKAGLDQVKDNPELLGDALAKLREALNL